MSEQKDNLHYQHQYAEDLDEENMSEIDRLEIKIGALKLKFDSDCDVILAEINALKKADEVELLGVKMSEVEGMIVVEMFKDDVLRGRYIYEDWPQVFRELRNEEEFKHE